MTNRLDLAWFAIAVGTTIWGLFIVSIWWSGSTEPGGWWAIDSRRVLEASAVWLAGGDPYGVYGFVYSPLALLAALPFRIAGEWAWFAVEAFALVWIMLKASRGLNSTNRAFVVLTGFLFLPATSDLLLGNVTLVLTAVALIAISSDRVGSGVAFGLGLAAVPKPLFVPIVLWMFRYRRRSLGGVVVGGLIGSAIGIAVLGPDRYWTFISTLANGAAIPSDFVGNNGLSAYSPALGLIGNIVALGVVGVTIALAPLETSLVVASLAGVFMGSYAGLYAALPLLIALPLFASRHRRRAFAISGLTNGFVIAMPLFAVAAMLATVVPFRRTRVPTASPEDQVSGVSSPRQSSITGEPPVERDRDDPEGAELHREDSRNGCDGNLVPYGVAARNDAWSIAANKASVGR